MRDDEALDRALDVLADYGPDLRNGFTSHAPMVVEALCALGRPEAVLPWLQHHQPDLLPRPAPRQPIEPAAWREALGQEQRTADWMQLLRDELAQASWRELLARWVPRLAPGFCASANHGVLRVGHAARALAQRETAQRKAELADALGAWAANYQTLPTPRARSNGRRSVDAATRTVPLQPQGERSFAGSIVSGLTGLARFEAFAPVIDWIEVEAPGPTVSALTQAFARVFLSNARDPLSHIVFVHAVTAAAALRSLLPWLDEDAGRELIRYGWQAGAALYASFGSEPPVAGPLEAPRRSRDALIDAAIACGDDHAIKFTEACLREYAHEPAPVYLRAADHALAALCEAGS